MKPFVRLCHGWDTKQDWVSRAATLIKPLDGDYEALRDGLANCAPGGDPWPDLLLYLRDKHGSEVAGRVVSMAMRFANEGAEAASKERYEQAIRDNAVKHGPMYLDDDTDTDARFMRWGTKDKNILAMARAVKTKTEERRDLSGLQLKNAVNTWMVDNVAEDYGIDKGEALEMLKEMELY